MWEDTDVIVADTAEPRIDELVAWMEAQPTLSEEAGPAAAGAQPDAAPAPERAPRSVRESGAIAGPGRRLVGFAADEVIWSAFAVTAMASTGLGTDLTPVSVASSILLFAYRVVPVAIYGRTLGKVVAGTRVVRASDRALPGWRSAFVRWLVPSLPWTAVALLGTPAGARVAALVATTVIYGALLLDASRRGLHDRAAGTVVAIV